MDTLFERLGAGDFLTFIALCIAVFAFLCTYLSFPKNFLKNLALLNCNESKKEDNKKKIKQPSKKSGNSKNSPTATKRKIIKYFFLVDLFTGWILVFLILAIISSLGFLIVKLQLAWFEYPHKGLKWFFFLLTIGYIIIMTIIFTYTNRLRKDYWNRRNRLGWLTFGYVLMLCGGVPLLYFSWPCSLLSQLGWFFISLLSTITILFICLVFVLARYNPLTALAMLWNILDSDLGNTNKKKHSK